MAQISRPYQVVLAATMLFFVVWMVALRPKAADPVAPAQPAKQPVSATGSPGETPIGKAVNKAKGANAQEAAAAQASAEASESVDGTGPAGKTVDPPAIADTGKPIEKSAGPPPQPTKNTGKISDYTALPFPVAKALATRKVLVLMFWNARSSDDRAERAELQGLNRRGGRVVFMSAPIRRLSRYTAITRAVPVYQSPTVVVVDRRLQAKSIIGYVDRATVNEIVLKALANGTRRG